MPPSSVDYSSLRYGWFPGHREAIPQRPFSFVEETKNNDNDRAPRAESPHPGTRVDTDALQEYGPMPPSAREKLKQRLLRMGSGVLDRRASRVTRKADSKGSTSSSDLGTAPNKPYIPPSQYKQDSSSTETIKPRMPHKEEQAVRAESATAALNNAEEDWTAPSDPEDSFTPQNDLSEITELVRERTASSSEVLRRLDSLDFRLDVEERKSLLMTAKSAAHAARTEYIHLSRKTEQPEKPPASKQPRDTGVPLADVRDFLEYLDHLKIQAKQLEDNVRGLDVLREVWDGVRCVRNLLDDVTNKVDRSRAEAEMTEVRWLVERKSM